MAAVPPLLAYNKSSQCTVCWHILNLVSHRDHFKCDVEREWNQPDGVQQLSSRQVLRLLWILTLFPLDEQQFWGYSQWQSSAHRRKLHSHYSQRDPLWPGTVHVSCVQSCQQWHQWCIKLYHQLWVILSPPCTIFSSFTIRALKCCMPLLFSFLRWSRQHGANSEWK